MVDETVRAVFWQGDRPVIVEGVPAHVCRGCMEQFYDEAVSEALRRLAEDGFPVAKAVREERVAVFTLEGRIRENAPGRAGRWTSGTGWLGKCFEGGR
jgi:YgiT-type zinc finger domain-containing protein